MGKVSLKPCQGNVILFWVDYYRKSGKDSPGSPLPHSSGCWEDLGWSQCVSSVLVQSNKWSQSGQGKVFQTTLRSVEGFASLSTYAQSLV